LPQGTREAIIAGEEIRPQGAFALSIRKNMLYVEPRNGAGYKPMMEELKATIN